MNNENNLNLLRFAVQAKVKLWDALRELDYALSEDPEEPINDRASDAISEHVSYLAAALPAEGVSAIDEDNLGVVIAMSKIS